MGERVLRMVPAGPHVYQGTSGIAVFLLECWHLTGDSEILHTALGALRHAVAAIDTAGPGTAGYYCGDAGAACVAARFASILGDSEFGDAARRFVDRTLQHPSDASTYDLLAGTAGDVAGYLELSRALHDDRLIACACASADQLITTAVRGAEGWGWGVGTLTARPLVGLSHGTAGVAYAFLELFAATSDDRYRFAAEQALAYEQAFFDRNKGDWLDLRHSSVWRTLLRGAASAEVLREEARKTPRYVPEAYSAWCHGAPGIALARMHAHTILGNTSLANEAAIALDRTHARLLEKSITRDFTLCHGVAGFCDILLSGAAWSGNDTMRKIATEVAMAGAETNEGIGRQWTSGTLGGGYDPSLFLGEAGIGLLFLRLASDDVPSALLPLSRDISGPVASAGESDAARLMRRLYVRHYFGETMDAIDRDSGTSWSNDACCLRRDGEVGRSVIIAAFETIEQHIANEPDHTKADAWRNQFRVERSVFHLATHLPYDCDMFLERAARAPLRDSELRSMRFVIADHVSLVRDQHGAEGTYVVFPLDGVAVAHRLEPIAGVVFDCAEEGGYFADVLEACGAEDMDPPARTRLELVVEEQLRMSHHAGLIVFSSVNEDVLGDGARMVRALAYES